LKDDVYAASRPVPALRLPFPPAREQVAAICLWYNDTAPVTVPPEHSLHAKTRKRRGQPHFSFDELVSLTASRLKATGAIRLEDRQILIPFGGRTKLIGVAHTVFRQLVAEAALAA
jgi:hypothetical protein